MKSEFLTPVKAIRAKCLDCCYGQTVEVKNCPCADCALHPYRMGHRPIRTVSNLSEKTDSYVEVSDDET